MIHHLCQNKIFKPVCDFTGKFNQMFGKELPPILQHISPKIRNTGTLSKNKKTTDQYFCGYICKYL